MEAAKREYIFFVDQFYDDVLFELYDIDENWKNNPNALIELKDERMKNKIAVSFFQKNQSWLDECVPAAINFQLEWICHLFEDDSGIEFVESTQKQIFRYIHDEVVLNLIHREENRPLS